MKYRRLVNKIICTALICTMMTMTGCLNNETANSDIDKNIILDSIIDDADSSLDDTTEINGSEVKSVETNQSYDGSIELNGEVINFSGSGATVDGSSIKITQAGTYIASGKLDDGQIIIETDENSTVNLILNGVDISCSYSSAIYSKKANETKITILNGSINKLADGNEYKAESTDTDAPTACLYSQDDLGIYGTGTLYVSGNYNDAITSKDILTINEGIILVSSVDDAIVGRDGVIVKNGDIKIISEGDGIKSTNDEDSSKGYITIDNGIFNITAGKDGIQAETDLTVNGGSFTIATGGGSENGNGGVNQNDKIPPQQMSKPNKEPTDIQSVDEETASAKAIKCKNNMIINGGSFNIDSSDDSIHSNLNITINDADINILSGDDGIHADSTVEINDGTVIIAKSYEGIEGEFVNISSGEISVISSDDGINISGGNDGSSINGRIGQNKFISSGDGKLKIDGGNITVNASGDGLDANGSIYMTGGRVIVFGPTNDGNGSLDYDGECKISGGVLIATGSAGMLQTPSIESTQCSVSITMDSAVEAKKTVAIKDSSGNTVVSAIAEKQFQNIIVSAPNLEQASTYTLYVDDTVNKEFTVTNVVTIVGNRLNGGGRR